MGVVFVKLWGREYRFKNSQKTFKNITLKVQTSIIKFKPNRGHW